MIVFGPTFELLIYIFWKLVLNIEVQSIFVTILVFSNYKIGGLDSLQFFILLIWTCL